MRTHPCLLFRPEAGGTADSADTCSAVCGDKQLGGAEECDDGNQASGLSSSNARSIAPGSIGRLSADIAAANLAQGPQAHIYAS